MARSLWASVVVLKEQSAGCAINRGVGAAVTLNAGVIGTNVAIFAWDRRVVATPLRVAQVKSASLAITAVDGGMEATCHRVAKIERACIIIITP